MAPHLRTRTLPLLLLLAGVIAAVAIMHPTHPAPATKVVSAPARATNVQHSVPLRPALSKLVLRFVKTAVMREHATRHTLLQGWRLTGPKLKQGTTLHDWLAGTSSVTPFPDGAVAPGLHVDHSYADDALLELALYPKARGSVPPGVFLIGLHRYGAGASSRWLVDYWAPHGSSSAPAATG
ncbi:MAG: hypothetical protein ABI317_04560 [Gaiellales bacterium]